MNRAIRQVVVFIVLFSLAMSCTVTAHASSRERIDGVSGDVTLADAYTLGQSSSPYYSGERTDSPWEISVTPGEEIRIPLTADMFTWSNDRTPLPGEAILLNELTRSRVSVRTRRQAGAEALDYVQLDRDRFAGEPFFAPGTSIKRTGTTAYISVMFAKEFHSVVPLEFEFDIYLLVGGKQHPEMKLTLQGELSNPTISLWEGADWVNLADGTVAHAQANLSKVSMRAGNGVTIQRHMLRGEKYYATTKVMPATIPDFEVNFPFAYPSVIAAYQLNGVNLQYGSKVKIDPKVIDKDWTGKYYVYNEDMEYLGTTADALYYSEYYFLSTEEIDTFEQSNYEDLLEAIPITEVDYQAATPTPKVQEETVWKNPLPQKNTKDESPNVIDTK